MKTWAASPPGVGAPLSKITGVGTARRWKKQIICSFSWPSSAWDRHCRHHTGRGVMKFYESGAALAEDMGVPIYKMQDSVEAHCQASLKTAEDPDGGPCPAHPLDVVEKCAPDANIGVVGSGEAKNTDKGDAVANLEAWRDWRIEAFDDTPGVFLVNVRSYVNAGYYLILSIICEICATNFFAKNFKISNDRGLHEVPSS